MCRTSTNYFNEEIIDHNFLKYILTRILFIIFVRRVDLIPNNYFHQLFQISNQEKDEIELVAMRWQRRKKS